MRRAALLSCVNIDVPRFKVLRTRDQLPIVVGSLDEADSLGANYSLDDAFRIRFMLDLIGDGDDSAPAISPSDASKVVINCMGRFSVIGRHPLDSAGGSDLWGGVIVFEDQNDGTTLRFTNWFAGELDTVMAHIAQFIAASEVPTVPVRCIIANASRAARLVRQRATDLDIPERHEINDEWAI